MKCIIEKLSWVPRNILMSLAEKNNRIIKINFNKIGISKKIKFHTLKGDMGLSVELKAFGFREPLYSNEYYNFISQDDIVLDIGSNLGYFPILASRAKKIICVEPLKGCIPILKKNLDESDISDMSVVVNMAVGKKQKMFIEKKEKVNHSKVTTQQTKNCIEVDGETIKYFIDKFKINVLRMDLEGYEYDLLYKNIPKSINKISLEFHTGIMGIEKTKKILDYFQREGFLIKSLIQELPLRFYPFYCILKKTGLIKKFTYIEKDIEPKSAFSYFSTGRSVKHLNLERGGI